MKITLTLALIAMAFASYPAAAADKHPRMKATKECSSCCKQGGNCCKKCSGDKCAACCEKMAPKK